MRNALFKKVPLLKDVKLSLKIYADGRGCIGEVIRLG